MAKKRLIKQDENKSADSLFVRVKIPDCSANDIVLVDEAHNAVVIKNGQLLQTLNAGRHQIVKYGKSKDLYEVVFFPKTSKIKMLWGTKEQFSFRDPLEDVVLKVGANGEIDIQITSPRKFFLELGNKKENFTVLDLKENVQAKLLTYIEEFIAKYMQENKISYDSFEEKKSVVATEIKPYVSNYIEKDFGLKIASLTINGVIIPNQYINQLISAREKRLSITHEKVIKKVAEEEKHQQNQQKANTVANEMLDNENKRTSTMPENEHTAMLENEQTAMPEKEQDGMLLL